MLIQYFETTRNDYIIKYLYKHEIMFIELT